MKIKNASNTATDKCPNCGDWIDHWQRFSEQKLPPVCPVYGCTETKLEGAHIELVGYVQENQVGYIFIVPLCHTHNMTKDELDTEDIALVHADLKMTCGNH